MFLIFSSPAHRSKLLSFICTYFTSLLYYWFNINFNFYIAILQAGEIGANEAKKLAPVGRRGKYKEQIKTVYDPNSKQAVVFVDGSEASLSHLLEDGHRVGKKRSFLHSFKVITFNSIKCWSKMWLGLRIFFSLFSNSMTIFK